MAASIRATPKNELMHLIGSGLGRVKKALNNQPIFSPEESRVFGDSPLFSLGNLLLGEAPEAIQDWSYEGSRGPISGRNLQTMKIDPRVLDVAGLAAAGAPVALKAARAAAPTAAKQAVQLMEKYGVSPTMYVIKPEGGNWLGSAIPGKPGDDVQKLLDNMNEALIDEDLAAKLDGRLTQETIDYNVRSKALNQWKDSVVRKYIINRMGTPSDEIRRLADEGVTHLPQKTAGDVAPSTFASPDYKILKTQRKLEGFNPEGEAKTLLGSYWEQLADKRIAPNKIEDFSEASKRDWMNKLAPDDRVYNITTTRPESLGFDHIQDVIREDLETGRLRPENLNKLSMEQAIRRTHEYDQEMAKRMAETQAKEQAGLPVVKEYPEQGFKWLELNAPDNPELTEKALKYEGDKMGHCVGGYCELVKSGDTNIFSLRDAKGEPHVTIEVTKQPYGDAYLNKFKEAAKQEALEQGIDPESSKFIDYINSAMRRMAEENALLSVNQIKGKQNQAPKKEYQQYVQDFLNSRPLGDVKDLQNTGLIDLSKFPKRQEALGKRFVTEEELNQYLDSFSDDPQMGYAAGGLVTGDYDDNQIDALADDLLGYGLRQTGEPKSTGALGEIRMPNGRDVMTEYSINVDGEEMPSIVEGMHPADINYLRETGEVPEDAVATAIRSARRRKSEGKPVFYAEGGEVDLEKLSKIDTAKALLKGLGLRLGKYPIMGTKHGAYPNKIRKELIAQYPEQMGTKRKNRSPLDTAINYGGVYDLASDPRMEPQDLKDMALAYQLYDYVTGDKADAIKDYQENMAGIAAATSDRTKNRRASEAEVARRAAAYAKEQNSSFPEYAEGGLVYDDSKIDELANQLLGM